MGESILYGLLLLTICVLSLYALYDHYGRFTFSKREKETPQQELERLQRDAW